MKSPKSCFILSANEWRHPIYPANVVSRPAVPSILSDLKVILGKIQPKSAIWRDLWGILFCQKPRAWKVLTLALNTSVGILGNFYFFPFLSFSLPRLLLKVGGNNATFAAKNNVNSFGEDVSNFIFIKCNLLQCVRLCWLSIHCLLFLSKCK